MADGRTDPTGSMLEPEFSRESLEFKLGLELDLTPESLRFNSEGLTLLVVLRLYLESDGVLGSRLSLGPTAVSRSGLVLSGLHLLGVLDPSPSPEPKQNFNLELAWELNPVLESKLSFKAQLVLEAEPLLESRLSLDPFVVLQSGQFSESRLSVALEFELDLEFEFDPKPALESFPLRFSLDPGVLRFLVPKAFSWVGGLGLKKLVRGVFTLSSAGSAL